MRKLFLASLCVGSLSLGWVSIAHEKAEVATNITNITTNSDCNYGTCGHPLYDNQGNIRGYCKRCVGKYDYYCYQHR